MIRAVIFDMDGVLIDTEPLWREVEIEVFGELGLHLTEDECKETMGLRIDEVVDLWHSRHPWRGPSRGEVARRIEDDVIAKVQGEGKPLAGAREVLQQLRQKAVPIAIASASGSRLIEAVVEKLGLAGYIDAIASSEEEREGKPSPDVFLAAARKLGIDPSSCLVVEDSPNGVAAAKAAGMVCVVIPDPVVANDPRLDAADMRLSSLKEFPVDLPPPLDSEPGP